MAIAVRLSCWLVLAVLVTGDLVPPYSYYTNYTDYGYSEHPGHTKRVFGGDVDNPYKLVIESELTVPVSGLNTEFLITMTNTFDLPSSRAITVTGGRALSGTQLASPRSAFYEQVESAVGRFTGAAGRDCLLRAMCEVAATPHHEEGLLGDAVNFVLTASQAWQEDDERFYAYRAAGQRGQTSGDCSVFHPSCPMSFFKFVSPDIP